jgi:phosphomannomutase
MTEAAERAGPSDSTVERTVPLPEATRSPVMERVRRTFAREAERVVEDEGITAHFPDGWLAVRPLKGEAACNVSAWSSTPERAAVLLERGTTLVHDLVQALGSADDLGDLWCDVA